ncbi:MAG: ribonuclease Y [Calditrichaeota bacterium]|nr:MAG: ribonuclease Y [Calditrichota bacterium]
MDITLIIVAVIAVGAGFAAGWLMFQKLGKDKIVNAEQSAKKIVDEAYKAAEELKDQAAEEMLRELSEKEKELERNYQELEKELDKRDSLLEKNELNLLRKSELLDKRERDLRSLEGSVNKRINDAKEREEQASETLAKHEEELQRIAELSKQEAVKILKERMKETARIEVGKDIKEIIEEAHQKAKSDAAKIVLDAMQKSAVNHVTESSVSVISLASDEMKGRIIGREGRNIRSFETITGVEIIIDDTPEAVMITSFDPFRREVARMALEILLDDGRIHPSRIEEVVEKCQKELEENLSSIGNETAFEIGVVNVPQELYKYLGMLKFRMTYGQNILQHSVEVALLAGQMAAELGFDPIVAKRAGLLHDIGKAVDRSMEGNHSVVGYELAKKYREKDEVLQAIRQHHDDTNLTNPIAVLVQLANEISASRPNARREGMEDFITRMEDLEKLAESYDGVIKAHAIQAGREVRVIIEPNIVDDEESEALAVEIANAIEEELHYPGQIKVTIVREYRSINFAK